MEIDQDLEKEKAVLRGRKENIKLYSTIQQMDNKNANKNSSKKNRGIRSYSHDILKSKKSADPIAI